MKYICQFTAISVISLCTLAPETFAGSNGKGPKVIWVGPGHEYTTIGAAVAAAPPGAVLYVAPGTYINDFASINSDLTIMGVGGLPHLVAVGQIPNGKAIFVTNGNISISHLEFSGATVADGNGAAIRAESGNLKLADVYIHDNQDGILTAQDPNATVTVVASEFSHNGAGDGYTHGLYAGHIAQLTIAQSYFHDTQVGHQIKSRAAATLVTGNYIADGPNGSASYAVDLPNGGNAVVTNNIIEKGPNEQNPSFIAFGEEGANNTVNQLSVVTNTFLNDSGRSTIATWNPTGLATVALSHDSAYQVGQILNGDGSATRIRVLTGEPALPSPTTHRGASLIWGPDGPTGLR